MSSADVFISYKSEEEAEARRIRDVLERNGISCWMAPDSIPAGSNYMMQIPQAIEGCKVMIVVISEKSQKSTWVKNEFSEAVSKNKLVIPYVIQDCRLQDDFAFSMSTIQQVYAWKNEEQAMQRVVRDIRQALGEADSARVEISVVKKPKVSPWIYPAAAVLICALIAGIFFLQNRKPAGNSDNAAAAAQPTGAEVYYSEIVPFYSTGSYRTVQEAKEYSYAVPFYPKAFSLLSFIRNDSGSRVFVEKIACDLVDVKAVNEPVLGTDAFLEDSTIHAFAFNDGWGDAEGVEVSWSMRREDFVPEFPALEESLCGSKTVDIRAGGAAEIVTAQADFSELLEWARSRDMQYSSILYYFTAHAKLQEQESVTALFLMYDPETDSIIADYGGADEDLPQVTLYGVLDVDHPPASIRFSPTSETPLVEDTYRIETVIIPTKSCMVSLKGSYMIGGQPYETEVYDVDVRVPYFSDEAYIFGGPLTRELAAADLSSESLMMQICRKYRYDIESVLPPDAPR